MTRTKNLNHSTAKRNTAPATRTRMLAISSLMLLTVSITLLSLLPASASAQVHIQASVGGQLAPGVYGRVDFGGAPPPAVIYQQPVIVQQQPVYVQAPVAQTPIYLVVPPGHSRNRNQWHRYCARYNACAQPVYFVRPARVVAPRYYRHNNGYGHGHGYQYDRSYVQHPQHVYIVKAKHGKGHKKHKGDDRDDD